MARRSLAAWWHLLSLDAPTVAVTWCCAFARAAGAPLAWSTPLLLGVATWIPYVADRLLDARFAYDEAALRERHHFYGALLRDRRRPLLLTLGGVAGGCSVAGFLLLPGNLLLGYAGLSGISVAYFAFVHLGRDRSEPWLPKEAVVGAIFATGSALPAALAAPKTTLAQLGPVVVLFAVGCWLNCVGIERWEAARVTPGGVLTRGHGTTRWAARSLGPLLGVASVLSFVDLLVLRGPFAVLAGLLAVAFLLLLLLERKHRALTASAARVLADVALLTPLPWLAFRLAS